MRGIDWNISETKTAVMVAVPFDLGFTKPTTAPKIKKVHTTQQNDGQKLSKLFTHISSQFKIVCKSTKTYEKHALPEGL